MSTVQQCNPCSTPTLTNPFFLHLPFPDARYIAVTSKSPFLKIFDTDTAELVARVDLRHNGRVVSWHPGRTDW